MKMNQTDKKKRMEGMNISNVKQVGRLALENEGKGGVSRSPVSAWLTVLPSSQILEHKKW